MPSDIRSSLELLQVENYLALIIVTAVVYDYLLTFSNEVEYVWFKPWTRVSTAFLVVRYLGISWAIIAGLLDTTFIPGTIEVSTMVWLACEWIFVILYNTGDIVMILRVYAMWNRSKWVLCILLFIFLPQVVATFVTTGLYYNTSSYLTVTVVQILDISFCTGSWTIPLRLHMVSLVPRFTLSAALLVLAVIPTLRESIQMYRATKRWQPNRYMQHIMRDQVIYFLPITVFNIIFIFFGLSTLDPLVSSYMVVFYILITYAFLIPRFIVSVRKMYEGDLRGRRRGVDTGFGLLTQNAFSRTVVESTIAFADTSGQCDTLAEGGTEGSQSIQLVTPGDDTHQFERGIEV